MKKILSSILGGALLTGCGANQVQMPNGSCSDVAGVKKVLKDDRKSVIMFGHIHGTNESPKFVGDVLCHAVQDRKSVDLYLLVNAENQPFLDAFMASSGTNEDVERLLLSSFWANDNAGHSSLAMFNFVDIARRYKSAGADVKLWAYTNYKSPSADVEPYDSESQQQLAIEAADFINNKMKRSSADKHFILSGDADASMEGLEFATGMYQPMRKFLSENSVYSLRMMASGGNAWVCWISTNEKSGISTTECGGRDWDDDTEYLKSQNYPYGFLSISETTADYYTSKYDGFYFVGGMSASPPARTKLEKIP